MTSPVHISDYPKVSVGRGTNRTVRIHRVIAERAVGRKLKKGECVHHVDYNQANYSNENLVICPSDSYHKLLHIRTDALLASGNANYRKCTYCKEYGDPLTMYVRKSNGTAVHKECDKAKDKRRKHK